MVYQNVEVRQITGNERAGTPAEGVRMPTISTTRVIERLLTAVGPREPAALGDGELLRRFIEHRDEAALADLITGHGPMVWGVCRRLLGHHDAEDAFQATFIVLVHKAASVVPREMVGNWLYGVAHQTALQARRTAARRRTRELQVTQMPDTTTVQHDPWSDLRPLLDEELSHLPDNYRAVIVLCDLEGRTRKEVARQLDVPEGTVAGRLARARTLLAQRLTRRGVALSVGALAAALSQNASAGVPPAVESGAIGAASLLAAGRTAAGVISPKVAALTDGVLKIMLVSKLKAAVAVVLVLALVATGAMGFVYHTAAQDAKPPVAKEPVKPPQQNKLAPTMPVKEVSDLEGEWVVVAMEDGGETASADDVKGMKWSVKGNEITASQPDSTGKMSFKLDPEKMPKEIDITSLDGNLKGTMSPGIYAIEGRKFRVCFGEKIRPNKFATAPGDGRTMLTLEKEIPIAWGKEVGGLQAGLTLVPALARDYRPGEKVNLEVKLRNVGKADVTITYGLLKESSPKITDAKGTQVFVTMPPILGIIVIPTERVIKAGETITLYNPDVAVEALDRGPESGPIQFVSTPTIRVRPGKYTIAFGGMVHSHSTLSTGTTEFEVREPAEPAAATEEAFTAWGKEINGLQAGLGFPAGQKRAYRHGETVTMVVRVRNVGKEEIKFQYVPAFFKEKPPTVMDGDGKPVSLGSVAVSGRKHPSVDVTLAPGKETDLYEWKWELRPAKWLGNDGVPSLYGAGKFGVQYERVLGNSTASAIEIDPALSKLATGTLALDVKEAKKPPEKPDQEKEAFTAWGKEVGGLQAGLGFLPGQKRAYHHGETVTLVVRVRNVGKEAVKFEYLKQFLDENPPTVTDAGGKAIPQGTSGVMGFHVPVGVTLEPGKEIVIESRFHGGSGWPYKLLPVSGGGKPATQNWPLVVGTGKVSLRHERVLGNSSSGQIKIDPALSKLATGTLELEIEPAPPVTAEKK